MLHILLFVLKIIGIIITAILGILVLLLCIVLFVPFRYEIKGRSEGTAASLKGKIKVTWLLHLFRADVYYKDQKLMWRIRFAWFKRMAGKKGGIQNENEEEEGQPISENVGEKPEEVKSGESIQEEFKEVEEDLEEAVEAISSDAEEHEENSEKVKKKRDGLLQKIQTFIKKIKCTIQGLCDKIKLLTEKKDKLTQFVQDETHIRAYEGIKKELLWYLKKLKPKKIEAVLRYGFDDPSYTGKLLAVLAVLYPFMSEETEIVPDFEHQVFQGRFAVCGKVKVSHIASVAWRLFWNKDVRSSYKDIKIFEW